jgi:hypothetical protein
MPEYITGNTKTYRMYTFCTRLNNRFPSAQKCNKLKISMLDFAAPFEIKKNRFKVCFSRMVGMPALLFPAFIFPEEKRPSKMKKEELL